MTGIVGHGTAGTILSLAYGYDAADNVHTLNDGVTPANDQTFAYDAMNRLASASGAYGAYTWTYDKIGDRLSEQLGSNAASTYAYASNSPHLASVTGNGVVTTVTTGRAGEITALSPSPGSATTMAYNDSLRLQGVTTPTSHETYLYDAWGRQATRTLQASPSVETGFLYTPGGTLLEEAQNTGGAWTAEADYISLNGQPLAVFSPVTGALTTLLDDRLGTPQKGTSSTQAVVWAATYLPFGQATTTGSITQDLRLPGQIADANTGLYQNFHRDYIPWLGRYLETDPLGLAAGVNTYAYAGQNPLRNVDPSGLQGIPTDVVVEEADSAIAAVEGWIAESEGATTATR